MAQLLPIVSVIFGGAFTVAVSWALGSLLLGRLRLRFHRLEAALFAFAAGSACLSLATFFLCLIHQARWPVFLIGGAGVVTWAVWDARHAPPQPPLPPMPRAWRILFTVVFAAFFACYFCNALAPEISPDGSGYHLGNVARYWRHQGFSWDYHSLYSSLSQGMEMLFLVAFCFGRHPAAAMVHLAFQAALPLLMVSYGRRFGAPRAGAFAALLIYACPVAGIAGISAYNDLAVATLLFAGFYLIQVECQNNSYKLLFLIGFIAGFAFAAKYTAGLAFPLAVGLTKAAPGSGAEWAGAGPTSAQPGARLAETVPGGGAEGAGAGPTAAPAAGQGADAKGAGGGWLRRILPLTLGFALTAAPWLVRNWIWLGNPVAPFLNSWFPNPYWTSASEHQYLAGLRQYPAFKSYWEFIMQLTVLGGFVPGMIGPAFLLLPLSLLALRHTHGRRLLLAGAVYAIPACLNTEIRFLIPALPFFALALGLAMADSWGALPAVALLQSVLCWPAVMNTYCDRNAWRVRGFELRAALRLEPESRFIASHVGDYALKAAIEQAVPVRARIFSSAGRAAAYIDRDIVVGYESSQGVLVQGTLENAAATNSGQRAAALKVKSLGLGYLLVNASDAVAENMKNHFSHWGLTKLAEANGTTLYRID